MRVSIPLTTPSPPLIFFISALNTPFFKAKSVKIFVKVISGVTLTVFKSILTSAFTDFKTSYGIGVFFNNSLACASEINQLFSAVFAELNSYTFKLSLAAFSFKYGVLPVKSAETLPLILFVL